MNEVTLVGHVTANPIYRVLTGAQHSFARFNLAVQDHVGDEEPLLHRVVAFGRLADNINESLQGGLEVVVVGRFTEDCYESHDGDTPRHLVLVAEVVGPSLRFAPATGKRSARRHRVREVSPEVYDGD
jgi:single-stranded DNA-binding protein